MGSRAMAVHLTQAQISSFEDHGYIVLRDVLNPAEVKDLQSWAQEVHDWPVDKDVPYMPYEV